MDSAMHSSRTVLFLSAIIFWSHQVALADPIKVERVVFESPTDLHGAHTVGHVHAEFSPSDVGKLFSDSNVDGLRSMAASDVLPVWNQAADIAQNGPLSLTASQQKTLQDAVKNGIQIRLRDGTFPSHFSPDTNTIELFMDWRRTTPEEVLQEAIEELNHGNRFLQGNFESVLRHDSPFAELLDEITAKSVRKGGLNAGWSDVLKTYKTTVDRVNDLIPGFQNLPIEQKIPVLEEALKRTGKNPSRLNLEELLSALVDRTVVRAGKHTLEIPRKTVTTTKLLGKTARFVGRVATVGELAAGGYEVYTAETTGEKVAAGTKAGGFLYLGVVAPIPALVLALADVGTSFVVEHRVAKMESLGERSNTEVVAQNRHSSRSNLIALYETHGLTDEVKEKILIQIEQKDLLREMGQSHGGWTSDMGILQETWNDGLLLLWAIKSEIEVEPWVKAAEPVLEAHRARLEYLQGRDIPISYDAIVAPRPEIHLSADEFTVFVEAVGEMKEAGLLEDPTEFEKEALHRLGFEEVVMNTLRLTQQVGETADHLFANPENFHIDNHSFAEQFVLMERLRLENPGIRSMWNIACERQAIRDAVSRTIIDLFEGHKELSKPFDLRLGGHSVDLPGYNPGFRYSLDDLPTSFEFQTTSELPEESETNINFGFLPSTTALLGDSGPTVGLDGLFVVDPVHTQGVNAALFDGADALFSFGSMDTWFSQVDRLTPHVSHVAAVDLPPTWYSYVTKGIESVADRIAKFDPISSAKNFVDNLISSRGGNDQEIWRIPLPERMSPEERELRRHLCTFCPEVNFNNEFFDRAAEQSARFWEQQEYNRQITNQRNAEFDARVFGPPSFLQSAPPHIQAVFQSTPLYLR